MAESDELRISVSLVDNASAGLAAMRREVKGLGEDAGKQMAPLKGAFEGVSKSIKEVTGGHTAAQFEVFKRSQIDMARIIKEGTDVTLGGEKALLGFIGRFGVAGAAVAGLGALAAAAAESNKKWADSVVEFHNKATLLGTDDANLQKMKKYADEAHVSYEDLTKIMRAQSEVSAGLKDPTSEMYKRLRDLTSDPRYFKSFEKFQEAWQAADDPMKRALVLQNAVQSMGESAADEERQRQQRDIAAGRQRMINEQQINDERKAGEHIAEQALTVPETILLLPKTMEAASAAQKALAAETLKSAQAVDAQFIKTEETVKRIWTEFESGISGPVLKAVIAVHDQFRMMERDYIRLRGTPAQKAEQRERDIKEAKERGEPPPPEDQNVQTDTYQMIEDWKKGNWHDFLFGRGKPGAMGDVLPGTLQPGPYAPPQWPTPAPTAPLAAPAPQPPLAPTYPQLGMPALPGAVPTPPAGPLPGSVPTPAAKPLGPGAPLGQTWSEWLHGLFGGHGAAGAHGPATIGPALAQAMLGHAAAAPAPEETRSRLALDDHQKATDQNTDQLKTLNDTLSQMTQKLQPVSMPAEAFPHPQQQGERNAELPLPPLPAVPPFRQPGEPGAPGYASVLRRHLGQPQFERALAGETEQRDRFRDTDEGQALQRNDRNELDRRILDFLKPLQVQVEGSGTLTANVTAPAGTRVGLEGRGLFKKTLLYRQTQMSLAATGPPNPAYSPTLEDFPL